MDKNCFVKVRRKRKIENVQCRKFDKLDVISISCVRYTWLARKLRSSSGMVWNSLNSLCMARFGLIWQTDTTHTRKIRGLNIKSAAGGSPCAILQGLPRAFTKSNKPHIS